MNKKELKRYIKKNLAADVFSHKPICCKYRVRGKQMKNNNEIKINHHKTFSKSGCVYQRGFKISKTILDQFLRYLKQRQQDVKSYPKSLYLNTIMEQAYKCVFMNLTQTEEFIKFMDKYQYPYNKQRASLKANGYLYVAL